MKFEGRNLVHFHENYIPRKKSLRLLLQKYISEFLAGWQFSKHLKTQLNTCCLITALACASSICLVRYSVNSFSTSFVLSALFNSLKCNIGFQKIYSCGTLVNLLLNTWQEQFASMTQNVY